MAHSRSYLLTWRRAHSAIVLPLIALCIVRSGSADVIVLANRTGSEFPLRFVPQNGPAQQLTLRPGENVPLYLDGKANVSFSSPGGSKNYLLDSNSAYFIGRTTDGKVDLQKIGLGDDGTLADGRSLPGTAAQAPTATITVTIFVDEDEPARQAVWEHRLRRRVEAASAVFEEYFHTKLKVVATGAWDSDNANFDFMEALAEFEREAKPGAARLAIGFTSQWKMEPGRMHMAGTRGPLSTHILVREGNPRIHEPERLEFLIHELGHFLGAAHSPERDSVMRPVLGDKQAGRTNFTIQLDPVNTLVIAMISDEMRRRQLTRLGELSSETRKRLGQIYMELARAQPDDPAAFVFAQLVKSESASPIVGATRQVLQQIVQAAADNRALPAAERERKPTESKETRREGDALTDYLVRAAARAAQGQPEELRTRAFLLAVVVGLEDGEPISPIPTIANVMRAIETPSERMLRLKVLGEPTIRGRRDLAKHFLQSAFLSATTNSVAAHAAGLAKELADAQGGSGFSFADLAADRAGVHFGQAIMDKRLPLNVLANTFKVEWFVPEVRGLPENLAAKEFVAQFGGKADARFTKEVQKIDQQISQLPAYRPIKIR